MDKVRDFLEAAFAKAAAKYEAAAKVCWFASSAKTRRQRLKWLHILLPELARIQAVSIYGTALMESDVSAVIDGNLEDIQDSIEYWKDVLRMEKPEVQQLWKDWPVLLEAALADLGSDTKAS